MSSILELIFEHNFINNVVPVHLLKIAHNMPTEQCSYCRYYLPNYILKPLILSPTYIQHKVSNVSLTLLII